MEKLILLQDDPNSSKLAKIASLLGVAHELVRVIPEEPSCVILRGRDYDAMRHVLDESPHAVLVYDVESSQTLSGTLKPIHSSSAAIQISRARADVTTVFSSLSFQSAATRAVFSQAGDFVPLLFADDQPFFLAKDRLFLLCPGEVLDIDTIAEAGCEPGKTHFAELIPFAMFIKWALKERCWRLPVYGASIVIDDPLLRPRYGFIDFADFLSWLKINDLAATFAFIPWNHNRSDPAIAKLFRDNPDRLSICVHGCDHIGGEFGIGDAARLDATVKTATARMNLHENRYDLPYDRVMVFPQGKFSREALEALGRNGCLAAVNSSVFPVRYNGELTVRQLLDLAVTTPSGVPLFRRRYPVDRFDFACDLFFEKPALIVQHHQDFENGFAPLLSFIQQLREVKPDLKWMPLGSVLAQSYWQKTEHDGSIAVRRLVGEADSGGSYAEMDYRLKERAEIAVRRYLSEFRDNVVQRNKFLSAALAAIRG
jgi:hypothetical protein